MCRSPNFQSHPAACTMERGDFAAKNSIFQSKIVSVRSLCSEILEISVKTGACSGNAEPPFVFLISSKAKLPAAQFEDFRRVTRQRARRPVHQFENAFGFFTESFGGELDHSGNRLHGIAMRDCRKTFEKLERFEIPLEFSIIPSSVCGWGGMIYAAENPLSRIKTGDGHRRALAPA